MTETSSQTATLSSLDALRKMGSAGKPLFFNQIKINDTVNPGEKGEVYIRGPHVTPGYIGRFANKDPLVDGWLPTGDIGYLDEEGYLYIIDRRSDLIISGGENIYPAEIENVLVSHPNVLEAGVCGKADEEWGMFLLHLLLCRRRLPQKSSKRFVKNSLHDTNYQKKFILLMLYLGTRRINY